MSDDNPNDNHDASVEYEEGSSPSDVNVDDSVADAQQSNHNSAIERAQERIAKTLDELFAAYQDAFTDYDDLEPREAFAKHMAEEYGVNFPEPESGFAVNIHGPQIHGIITGGRGGGITTINNFAMDYMADLVDGDLDRLTGWELQALAELDICLRMADTENVGGDLRNEAPNDAHRFVQALLEFFDNTDDGGSGNDALQGLHNILEKPAFLAWTFEALALDANSVVEIAAILGGGSGTAISILVDEFARIGLIGQGDVAVGFNLGIQQGRIDNDVFLGQFDDGTPRYTWHEGVAAAERAGQRIRTGNAQWALWTENIPLTYNFWALQNNPAFTQMRDFYGPVRAQASPESVEYAINNEPRFQHIGHTERDRTKALGEFAFRQLLRRPA
ncbi:hypothetical protein QA599_17850, partial [Haloarculaceae archaeon H-GB1-1]|nr:hypothetical protein [Haloarculaceae archaeon H-GB1-1]